MPPPRHALRRAAAHQLVADVDLPELDAASEHHLSRVLRLRDGDDVSVTDGRGAWRLCTFAGGALRVASEIVRETHPATLTVGVAVPKSDRPEWIVQKLTELGIDRIVLLHSERSVVRWDGERARRHVDRLTKIAVEALQQSRRVWLPTILGPDSAEAWLPRSAVAEPGGRPIGASDSTILIGPEGGWTEAELAQGADVIGLSESVLRVETAALVAGSQMATLRGGL